MFEFEFNFFNYVTSIFFVKIGLLFLNQSQGPHKKDYNLNDHDAFLFEVIQEKENKCTLQFSNFDFFYEDGDISDINKEIKKIIELLDIYVDNIDHQIDIL